MKSPFVDHDVVHDFANVVGTCWVRCGTTIEEREGFVGAVGRVQAVRIAGRVFHVVARGRKERRRRSSFDALLFGLVNEVGDAAAGWRGRRGAAKFFVGNLFTHDGADHVGAGDVHLADALDHEDEVGDGRGVDGAAGAEGPRMTEIWGTTPEAMVLRRKMSP